MKIEYNETYRAYMVNRCNETDNIKVTTGNIRPTITVNGVEYIPISVLDDIKDEVEGMQHRYADGGKFNTAHGYGNAAAIVEKHKKVAKIL